jgi:mRNA-degrading endonuclease RelE of RelBE toxin-antitoxin system
VRLKVSQQAIIDLNRIHVGIRARLWRAAKTLKHEPFPDGLYDDIEVESGPIRVYSKEVPPINKLKVKSPSTNYRILYVIDEPHDTAFVVSVRKRDVAYEATPMHLAMLRSIVKDYFENQRWENGH